MAKPKLNRQGLLGQFMLGQDALGAPVQTTVDLSPAYTRTQQHSGLVIGGRSANKFYHWEHAKGVILNVPGITIYRWSTFNDWTINDFVTLNNGLTVDGLIDPSSPRGQLTINAHLPSIAWGSLGVPPAATINRLHVIARCMFVAPLPQFIGFDTGLGNSMGFINSLSIILDDGIFPWDIPLGSFGNTVPLGFYMSGWELRQNDAVFNLHAAPSVFDIQLSTQFFFDDARFFLQYLQFEIWHTP